MSIYTDSNTAQLAYARSGATKSEDVTVTQLIPLNVLSDTFTPEIQTGTSDDIRDDGQYSISRNLGGSSGGDASINLRFGEYDDFLAAALRNEWVPHSVDPDVAYLWNGTTKIPFLFERRLKRLNDAGDETWNDYRRFFSQFLGSMSIDLSAKSFISASLTFMGLGFENSEANATADPLAGKLPTVTTYLPRGSNDPFDASNSVSGLTVKNSACEDMMLVLEQGSVDFSSDLREDDAVGHRYAANIGFSRFMATLDGTFYFRDQAVLNAMMNDEDLQVQFTLEDGDNLYQVTFPRMRVMSNGEEIGGVDETLRTPANLQAFPADVEIDGVTRNVTCWIKRVEKSVAGAGYNSCFTDPTLFTLNYTADVNGSITGKATQYVAEGSDGAEVTATPDAGYKFDAWSDGVLTAARTETAVTGDVTATATFAALSTFTLTYIADVNGSITGVTPQSVVEGSDGTEVIAVADGGYTFVTWSDGVTTAARTDLAVSGDVTVTATFA